MPESIIVERRKKIRIEDILVQQHIITQEQLVTAIARLRKTGRKLPKILVDLKYIEEEELLRFTANQLKIPYLNLSEYTIKAETVKLIPEMISRHFHVLLLESMENDLLVAMTDPSDPRKLDELSQIFKKNIIPVLIKEDDLLKATEKYYRSTEEVKTAAALPNKLLNNNAVDKADIPASSAELDVLLSSDKVSNAPLAELLESMFEEAVEVQASDIHIEPQEDKLLIRFGIDGQLHQHAETDLKIFPALIKKLKLMAGLTNSETNLATAGSFCIKVQNHSVAVRVAIMPCIYGESLVMRLQRQNTVGFSLENLGMSDDMLLQFQNLLQRPQGMVLFTGPTGSGKTTSFYTALSELNLPEKKVITLEDPVEYRLAGLNQIELNRKATLNFTQALPVALRQAPDIVGIGEVCTQETAQLAIRAAMSGPLILTTLASNSTLSVPEQLIEMGATPFMVGMALQAIVAQRLVRLVCKRCTQRHQLTPAEQSWLEQELGEQLSDYEFVIGEGCSQCHQTGYQGRIAIYELLEMNSKLVDAISHQDFQLFSSLAQQQLHDNTLRRNAAALAIAKRTTVAEAIRVSSQIE